MKIAVAQMMTKAGDLAATTDRMLDAARRASEAGCELVLFPLYTLTGPQLIQESDQEGLLMDVSEALEKFASEAACPCLVPISACVDGEAIPEAFLVRDGSIEAINLSAYLRSIALAPNGVSGGDNEAATDSTRGATLPVVKVGTTRVGVAFSYADLDEFDKCGQSVADILVFFSSYEFAVDDISSAMGTSFAESRFARDADATGAWVVGVGSLGTHGMEIFTGSSFVVAPWGELAAQAPAFEEDLLVYDIDPSLEGPLAHPLEPEVFDRPLALWSALSFGLAGSLAELGFTRAAVLLDGGLDSCVVTTLATDALGPTNVSALLVTGIDDTRDATARQLAQNLRLSVRELPLSALSPDRDLARDLAQAHLSALARETSAAPLSNLDKTGGSLELPVGSCDCGVIMPLGDVYRSDVLALAHLRNTISPVIPPAATANPDVPGVAGIEECGRTSVERIEFIDFILSSHIEWGSALSSIVDEHGHEETVTDILNRFADHEAARSRGELALTVSTRTLVDACWPLGLSWRDHLRDKDKREFSPDSTFNVSLGEELEEAVKKVEEESGETRDSDENRARDLSDVIGYLRDFALSGSLPTNPDEARADAGRHDSENGHHGPNDQPGPGLFWRTFSEN